MMIIQQRQKQERREDEFEVGKILKKLIDRNGEIFFWVKWKNYSSCNDTWEPEEAFDDKKKQILNFLGPVEDLQKR